MDLKNFFGELWVKGHLSIAFNIAVIVLILIQDQLILPWLIWGIIIASSIYFLMAIFVRFRSVTHIELYSIEYISTITQMKHIMHLGFGEFFVSTIDILLKATRNILIIFSFFYLGLIIIVIDSISQRIQVKNLMLNSKIFMLLYGTSNEEPIDPTKYFTEDKEE